MCVCERERGKWKEKELKIKKRLNKIFIRLFSYILIYNNNFKYLN